MPKNNTKLNSSTSQSERGVPLLVRQQLAKDIQKAGGIDHFDKGDESHFHLDDLLNKPDRQDIYDPRGKPLRKKNRNLVYVQ